MSVQSVVIMVTVRLGNHIHNRVTVKTRGARVETLGMEAEEAMTAEMVVGLMLAIGSREGIGHGLGGVVLWSIFGFVTTV